jgi:Tol biopolymer transport system component
VYGARANIWSLPIPARGSVDAAGATALTSGSQVIESIRVSPDGRWLVYDSDQRGNADIYRIPLAGGEPEQLTNDPADEFAPDLSPNGRLLAYHSWRSGTRDIEVKPLDGGPAQVVTATPGQESFPRWSPDGSSLVYYDQIEPFRLSVTRYDAGAGWSAPVEVARGMLGSAWSPDGRHIAGIARTSLSLSGALMVVPAAGGTPRALFALGPDAPPGDDVEWGRDGLVYYKAHDAAGRASLWAVDPAGGRPRLLVRFSDPNFQSSRKDFATDGKRLYFAIEDRQSDVFVAELR